MLDYNDSIFNHIKMDETNKQKFLSVYGIDDDSEDFSFSMVLPEDKWDNLYDAYSDDGSFPVSDLDSGITFQTGDVPIIIYEQMARDGIEFTFSWNSVSLDNEASFGEGEAKNGKLIYATDLEQIEDELSYLCGGEIDEECLENHYLEPRWITDDFIDGYGNHGYFDGDDFLVQSTIDGEEMYPYDVRAELDGEDGDGCIDGKILKVPVMYVKWWNENNGTDANIDFDECDYLFVNDYGIVEFLVDKDGNRVTSLSDADHFEPDDRDWYFYIVPASDFTDSDPESGLTEEAKAKWRKRFDDEKTKGNDKSNEVSEKKLQQYAETHKGEEDATILPKILSKLPDGQYDIKVTGKIAKNWYKTVCKVLKDHPNLLIGLDFSEASVREIGQSVFRGCTSLTSIVIPDSVTNIGDYAFSHCTSLTSIVIPDSVTEIGDNAFIGCTSLTSIVIPDSVTEIGNYAFRECPSLTSIVIPDSVTEIGEQAFCGCKSLTSIVIPDSVTKIGNCAFSDCTSLASVVIPASVTEIRKGAFIGCESLSSIVVNSNNPKYDSRDNCNAIIYTAANSLIAGCKNTVIPISVTSIGEYTFCGCTSLTSIEIPDSVTNIGEYAFYECTSLTSIVIPDSVTEIGEEVFVGCESLSSIVVNSNNPKYDSRDNCNAIIETAANCLIAGCKNTAIPIGVTKIGQSVFRGCTSLTSIVIPDSVTEIGDNAFSDCTSLTSIVIPNSVTEIGKGAFCGCTSLTSIVIPDSVTVIVREAFANCTSLTSIVIPDSVTKIGTFAFGGCTSLTSIVIPDSVTEIGEQAFCGCKSLTSIVIPDSVTKIGEEVFIGCESLSSIVVNSNNPKYDSRDNCNAIIYTAANCLIAGCKNTAIPISVTKIGWCAFKECTSLTSIEIPDSVTEIGYNAFDGCTSLTDVRYKGTEEQWNAVEKWSSINVTQFGDK